MRLSGEEAAYFERSVTRICARQAVEWIAASPENLILGSIDVAAARPFLTINDGGSLMAKTVNGKPRSTPHRLNKKARPESSATTAGDVAEGWREDPTDS